MNKMKVILMLGLILALAGCASGVHGSASADQSSGRARADVFHVPFP